MTLIPWIDWDARMVGRDSPLYADTLNTALRTVISDSGLDPDASFPGFATVPGLAAEAVARAAGDAATLVSAEAYVDASMTSMNTPNKGAQRDASGDFAMSTLTAEALVGTDAVNPLAFFPVLDTEVGVTNRAFPWGFVERYGAVGDANPVTGAGTDDSVALANALLSYPHITFGAGKQYRVTVKLDWSTVVYASMNGAVIHDTTDTADVTLFTSGTVGTEYVAASNIVVGTNVIESATLAAAVTQGDVILISSDALFISGGTIRQGEMKSVRAVSGSFVYLNEPIRDTYTTVNNARAGVVALAELTVDGDLTIFRHPSSLSIQTRGAQFQYCRVSATVRTINCQRQAISVSSCWKPDVTLRFENSFYTGSNNSYGLSVGNATTFGTFSVFGGGARHAFQMGGNSAIAGVAWDCLAKDSVATGLGGVGIFDCHEETGSITFDNCFADGGTMSDGVATTVGQIGFALGARNVMLRNCTARNCTNMATVRGPTVIDNLIVENFDGVGCTSSGLILNNTTTIRNLTIDGLTAEMSDMVDNVTRVAVNLNTGTVQNWSLNNIRAPISGGVISLGTALVCPATLRLVNPVANNPTTPTDTFVSNWRAIHILSPSVTAVELINPSIQKMSIGLRIAQSPVTVTRLSIQGGDFTSNNSHIYIDEAWTGAALDFRGVRFSASTHGVANHGVVRFATAGSTVTTVGVDGVYADTDNRLCGTNATVTTVLLGVNNFPSGFAVANTLDASWREILSGDQNNRIISRGPGSPEGVDTGRKGWLRTRSDGSAGTCVYVFEGTDDTNTGWMALLTSATQGFSALALGELNLLLELFATNLKGVYTINHGVTVESNAVASWSDLTEQMPTLAATSVGVRPTWDDTNKLVVGDGVSKFLLASSIDSYFALNGVAAAMAVVVEVLTPAAAQFVVSVRNGSTREMCVRSNTTGDIQSRVNNTLTNSGVAIGTTRRLVIVTKDASTTATVQVPAHAVQSVAVTASSAGSLDFSVLALPNGTSPSLSKIRAIALLQAAPTTQQADDLLNRWAIPYHSAVAAS